MDCILLKMSCMVVPIAFLKRQLNFSIKYDPGGQNTLREQWIHVVVPYAYGCGLTLSAASQSKLVHFSMQLSKAKNHHNVMDLT